MTNTTDRTPQSIAAAIIEPIAYASFGAHCEADDKLIKLIESRLIAGSTWRRRVVVECLCSIRDGRAPLDAIFSDLLCNAFDWNAKIGVRWLHEHPEYLSCARSTFIDRDASPDLEGFLSSTESAAAFLVRDELGELIEGAAS